MKKLFVFVDDPSSVIEEIKDARKRSYQSIKLCFLQTTEKPNKRDVVGSLVYCLQDKKSITKVNDQNLVCFSWTFADFKYENDAIKSLLKNESDSIDSYVLLSANHNANNTFFLDSPKDGTLPDKFYKIQSFKTYADIISYATSIGVIKFSLEDTYRFQDTGLRYQGQHIYQENDSRYHWYMDNFHKNHYEVFDPTGKKHLGEADMKGVLDRSKADSHKRIDDLL